ncbi:MAG: hypothetical protein KKH72_04595 [Alphaproteobacteria bacterium]|nr:hypothetical protein [Alphaproteobacteria bacterium]
MSEFKFAAHSGVALKSVFGVALAVALSACSMGSMFGSSASPTTTGSTGALANASPSQEQIDMTALATAPAIATECPPIRVRNGGEAIYAYQNDRFGDARSLQFEAVIDKQSRACTASNGLITVDMGVVGRVLLGPAGENKEYIIPVRFAVERDDLAVFSEKYDIPVSLVGGEQSQSFVKVVDNVAIPFVGGENIVIWVGFDTRS